MCVSHYTPPLLADLLVKQVPLATVERALDLGAGRGALTQAAIRRWPQAACVALDNNLAALDAIDLSSGCITPVLGDVILAPHELNKWEENFDLCLCNPPYIKVSNGKGKLIDACALFVGRAIRATKNGGYLAFVLPDGALNQVRSADLRREFVENHRLVSIIDLPRNAFRGIEVSTHLVILQKGGRPRNTVRIKRVGSDGRLLDAIIVNKDKLIHRMDFSFHNRPKRDGKSLTALGVEVFRGNTTRLELHRRFEHFVHTTELPFSPSTIDLKFAQAGNEIVTQSGDILVGRVGSRVMGRRAFVRSGCLPVSDCILILRAPPEVRETLWLQLSTPAAKTWLEATASGVGAKSISKSAIAHFTVEI